MRNKVPKDLTGMRFGRLTAIELVGMQGPFYLWKCKCDCGGEIVTQRGSLLSGRTRSCGCLRRETSLKNGKKAAEARRKQAKQREIAIRKEKEEARKNGKAEKDH